MWLGTFSVVVMGSAQWQKGYWFKCSRRVQTIWFLGVYGINLLSLRILAFSVFLYFDLAENSQIFGLAMQDDLDFDKRALVPLSLCHLGLLPPALKNYFCSIFMICIGGNYHL